MLTGFRQIASVLVKPAGPDCNLACRYCFYSGAASLYPDEPLHRMSDDVLRATLDLRSFLFEAVYEIMHEANPQKYPALYS